MTRRTKQQWQVLVEQHAQSELTTRGFCQQQNIHLQTFYLTLIRPHATFLNIIQMQRMPANQRYYFSP